MKKEPEVKPEPKPETKKEDDDDFDFVEVEEETDNKPKQQNNSIQESKVMPNVVNNEINMQAAQTKEVKPIEAKNACLCSFSFFVNKPFSTRSIYEYKNKSCSKASLSKSSSVFFTILIRIAIIYLRIFSNHIHKYKVFLYSY